MNSIRLDARQSRLWFEQSLRGERLRNDIHAQAQAIMQSESDTECDIYDCDGLLVAVIDLE